MVRRGKTGKTWKIKNDEKLVGFSSGSIFPARKQEVTHGGYMDKKERGSDGARRIKM